MSHETLVSAHVVCEGERDHEQRRCCEGPDVRRVVYRVPAGEFLAGAVMGADWCQWCRNEALASGLEFLGVDSIQAVA